MRIQKFCGRERLPGGARLWHRLARKARFDGVVKVYGYGVAGQPGQQHRAAMRTGNVGGMVIARWWDKTIEVWLPCKCAAAEFDDADLAAGEDPLSAYAHELGHFALRGKARQPWVEEAVATKYGKRLLRTA